MSIIKKNPGKLKKLLQSIPIPGWLFSLVTVVYCEVLLHLWTMNDFSLGRFAAVVLFALGFGGLLGQIAGFIGHRTWGKWVTAALAAVISVFYIVEYFVNDAYQSFMPMRMLLGGAKGVTTDFGDVVVSLVLNDLWRILVMLLPALLFALLAGAVSVVVCLRRGTAAQLVPPCIVWGLGLAAPASWMVLSKAHAAIHTHLVPMLWHFAFVPISCMLLPVLAKLMIPGRKKDLVASH